MRMRIFDAKSVVGIFVCFSAYSIILIYCDFVGNFPTRNPEEKISHSVTNPVPLPQEERENNGSPSYVVAFEGCGYQDNITVNQLRSSIMETFKTTFKDSRTRITDSLFACTKYCTGELKSIFMTYFKTVCACLDSLNLTHFNRNNNYCLNVSSCSNFNDFYCSNYKGLPFYSIKPTEDTGILQDSKATGIGPNNCHVHGRIKYSIHLSKSSCKEQLQQNALPDQHIIFKIENIGFIEWIYSEQGYMNRTLRITYFHRKPDILPASLPSTNTPFYIATNEGTTENNATHISTAENSIMTTNHSSETQYGYIIHVNLVLFVTLVLLGICYLVWLILRKVRNRKLKESRRTATDMKDSVESQEMTDIQRPVLNDAYENPWDALNETVLDYSQ